MKKIKINKNQLESIMMNEYVNNSKGIKEDLAWATDGRNYNKPEHHTAVTPHEAERINNEANKLYNELFTGEGVAVVGKYDTVKQEIVDYLCQSGIQIGHTNNEDESFYWITDVNELEMAERKFDSIAANLYDNPEN